MLLAIIGSIGFIVFIAVWLVEFLTDIDTKVYKLNGGIVMLMLLIPVALAISGIVIPFQNKMPEDMLTEKEKVVSYIQYEMNEYGYISLSTYEQIQDYNDMLTDLRKLQNSVFYRYPYMNYLDDDFDISIKYNVLFENGNQTEQKIKESEN